MNFKKTALSAAVVAGIGFSAAMVSTTASAALTDHSTWALTIVPTGTKSDGYGGTIFKIGKDGNYQSSFSFGHLPDSTSNGMTDNGVMVNNGIGAGGGNSSNGAGVYGTSIASDGFAGIIEMGVTTGGAISVAGTSMVGSISGTALTFTPNDRFGAINAPNMVAPWNINNFTDTTNTSWGTLTTGSVSAAAGTINGAALTEVADIDGDLINDFSGVLVGGGQVGSDWGSFFGATYYETWRFNLLSATSAASGDSFNVDTIFATAGGDFAQYVSAVPVPAAVWLFGSGLMGLVGVARRKKA